jgi:cyclic 2,3-diphosphoglycerate synthetase
MRPRAVVLIDGEHYPPVVRATLTALAERFELAAALFLGGEEKLRPALGGEAADAGDAQYGVPLVRAPADSASGAPGGVVAAALGELLAQTGAAVVIDLSDEPVLGYRERFALISSALARGARYVGADFEFTPQHLDRLSSKPSLAIIGTGKRVGKTAVSGHVARLLSGRLGADSVVVLAMGRGGPERPELIDGRRGLAAGDLLAASRRGGHAASDCYEDAVLAGVVTIGCRRCGGGMAGAAFDSNVREALTVLEQQPAQLALLEGSGSVIPPVRADGTVCVSSAAQPMEYVVGYLGAYRMLLSDLLVLTMCEAPHIDEPRLRRLIEQVRAVNPGLDVIPTVFRPRPAEPIRGRRVAFFTTADAGQVPVLVRHLEEQYGAEVTCTSSDLARRPALAAAVRRAAREADVFLTEIKAAAIDVVAEAAAAGGREIVFCDNEPLSLGEADLDAAVVGLAERCRERFGREG